MRVLHLFSNGKWTGPAEPALRLCLALRDAGVQVDFACAPEYPGQPNLIVTTARSYGLEPLNFMRLSKHHNPFWNWLDSRALRRHLNRNAYDLVHCHLDNDHEIALAALADMEIPVVRSVYSGEGMPDDRRHRRFAQRSAVLIEVSEMGKKADQIRFGLAPERIDVVGNGIDTARFDPTRPLSDMRASAGISKEAFVVGIVARMQRHRRYEDLFDSFARLLARAPAARLIVVGRGTRQEDVAFAPVRRLHLEKQVHFTGYLNGDDYVAALAAFDVGLFLVPGSDGSCRAVREMMSMGKPMVVADRGMLREMVTHGENGLVTDGSPQSLTDAFVLLHDNKPLRQRLALKAGATASTSFSLSKQADAIMGVYKKVLS